MSRYAASTAVPVERSRSEIERVLERYGCSRFGIMNEAGGSALLYFEHAERSFQLAVRVPPQAKFQSEAKWQQERRRRWRVMVLTLKASLEAVASGLATFEEVFLAHVVIPGTAKTLGQALIPKLDALYAGKPLPALLAENP